MSDNPIQKANEILDLWEKVKPYLKRWWPLVLSAINFIIAYMRHLPIEVTVLLTCAWLFLAILCAFVIADRQTPYRTQLPVARTADHPNVPTIADVDVDRFYQTYDNQMLAELEQLVRVDIDKYPNATRETVLVRRLAATYLEYIFEMIWLHIFQSQILALEAVNRGVMRIDDLEPYYNYAVSQNPQFYATYSFNSWYAFMKAYLLVGEFGDEVQITIRGQAFLKYLIQKRLSFTDRRN